MDNIINFSTLRSDSYLLISIVVVSLFFVIFIKRMTASFIIPTFIIPVLVMSSFSGNKIITLFVSILLLSLLIYIKIKRPELDYKNKVFNLRMFSNQVVKKDTESKFVGKIIPYNDNQLKHNRRPIKFKDIYACGCTLITGSTGSGKTYGMESLIKQDMNNGHSVAYFDYKGDVKVTRKLKKYAEEKGLEVYEISPDCIDFNYDPLADLNPTGRVEALLNTRKWSMDGSDAHYRTSTQLLIQKLVNTYDQKYTKGNNYVRGFYEFVKTHNYDRASYDAYITVLKMLELLITSNLNSVWLGKNNKTFKFSNDQQYLVIFSFVSSNKELANSLSSFAYRDLLDTGTITPYDKELALYVDEYGTLENSFAIKDIIEKGRSCGIMTTLSMQDVNQVVINTNQAYLDALLGTINTFIIYSGVTKSTAEIMAGVQSHEIDKILLGLKKPMNGKPPTAMYISKYATIEKSRNVDVFKIEPYILKTNDLIKEKILPEAKKTDGSRTSHTSDNTEEEVK